MHLGQGMILLVVILGAHGASGQAQIMCFTTLCFFGRIADFAKEGVVRGSKNQVTTGEKDSCTILGLMDL